MGVTIYDIAKMTGCNPGTVSRALNGDPRVKEKTREKIKKAGARLGYIPNLAAKSLITGRTGILAVVSVSSVGGPMTSLMLGVNKILIQHDYLLMSLIYNNQEQFQRCLIRLRSGLCDGVILLSPLREYAGVPEFDMLRKSSYPLVCFDQWIPEFPFPVVTNDAEKSVALLTEKLLENGMDAAFLNYRTDNSVAVWRNRCAETLLRKAHIPYTADLAKLPEFLRKNPGIRNLGIYSDSADRLDLIGSMLPADRKFRCLGGIFDSWTRNVPRYFSRYFLCEQDIDRESEIAVNMLFGMMKNEGAPAAFTAVPPRDILTSQDPV